MFRFRGIVVPLVAMFALFVGCEKAAKEAVEGAVESRISRDGGKANVEIGDESFSMRVDGQDGDSRLDVGSGTKVPKEFPKDIPLYSNMTVVMSHSQARDQMFVIQATSQDSVAKVSKFYETELPRQGWKEENATVVQDGKTRSLGYEKQGRVLQVTAMDSDDEGTSLSITTRAE
ncbi:MAG: hypothetical protein R6U98_22075 [Pirellulaceae bacterium]